MKMDLVADIPNDIVLEHCPCCGSPAQLLEVTGDRQTFYVVACSNTQAPADPEIERCPLVNGTSRSRYEKLSSRDACARWNVFACYHEHKRLQNSPQNIDQLLGLNVPSTGRISSGARV